MVCLGFEHGPQDGRRRWNQGAMAATLESLFTIQDRLQDWPATEV